MTEGNQTMTTNREPQQGDRVSYRRRPYRVRTVWGGANAGNVSIMPLGPDPHAASHTLRIERLTWSETRVLAGEKTPGCWIVVKP